MSHATNKVCCWHVGLVNSLISVCILSAPIVKLCSDMIHILKIQINLTLVCSETDLNPCCLHNVIRHDLFSCHSYFTHDS